VHGVAQFGTFGTKRMSQDLQRRVERLEKQNKILFAILLSAFLVFGFYHFRQSDHVSSRIRTHEIDVVGEAGSNAASLSATRDGWVLLGFQDLNGKPSATLMMTPSGKSSLTFYNEQARLNLGVVDETKNEDFSIQLMDKNGKVIWRPNVPNNY